MSCDSSGYYCREHTEIKFEIWRDTFLKSFLPLRNHEMDFQFSENNEDIVGKCTSIE